MNNISILWKKYKDTVCLGITLILIMIFGLIRFVVPEINKMKGYKQEISANKEKIANLQFQLRPVQVEAPRQTSARQLPVSLYTSPYPGLDIETASVDLVDEFIGMIRDTQNRIVEISFNAKPADPSMPTNTLSLNMSLNCSYVTLQNLLQKVYTWKYLAAIKDISITPEQGNPSNLSAKLTIDLFIN